jgi:hypothetical protein
MSSLTMNDMGDEDNCLPPTMNDGEDRDEKEGEGTEDEYGLPQTEPDGNN